MSRIYPRLTIEAFGAHLLETGDLDPVYVALNGHDAVPWRREQKERFLVAYWCLYHCGAAAYLSEFQEDKFWHVLMEAARNTTPAPHAGRWPRGHERRHWRGKQATDSCTELAGKYYRPEKMVWACTRAGNSFAAVSAAVQEHRGFGPWIAFKVCDMLDRCLDHRVDFTEDAAFNGIFKDPVESALQLWRVKQGFDRNAAVHPKDRAKTIHGVIEYLREHFDAQGHTAPPLGDRQINVQEVETILCKWKSHMNGHYPLNNDIDEIHNGLLEWSAHSQAVVDFQAAMPPRRAP
jgi:hypothetical protein